MIPQADFFLKEVPTPPNRWCRSGHQAPASFRREGPTGIAQPTKFFMVVSDKNPKVDGIYCEPCLIVANAMKQEDLIIVRR